MGLTHFFLSVGGQIVCRSQKPKARVLAPDGRLSQISWERKTGGGGGGFFTKICERSDRSFCRYHFDRQIVLADTFVDQFINFLDRVIVSLPLQVQINFFLTYLFVSVSLKFINFYFRSPPLIT
jgi:hypothetical protein